MVFQVFSGTARNNCRWGSSRRSSDYVLERVMARGGWVAMSWLRCAYAPEVLADFLRRKGSRLAPRELAYWAVIAGIEVPIPRGGGRPPWAGS